MNFIFGLILSDASARSFIDQFPVSLWAVWDDYLIFDVECLFTQGQSILEYSKASMQYTKNNIRRSWHKIKSYFGIIKNQTIRSRKWLSMLQTNL